MNDIVYVDYKVDHNDYKLCYNLDEDDDWYEYEYLDEDENDFVDSNGDDDWDDDEDEENDSDVDEDDYDDSDDDEDEENDSDVDEDDLAAEDEDDKMLFKKKFRPFKHIMGPFKQQVEEGKSGFDCYRALLTPGHHHLIRRKSDDADNNLLKPNLLFSIGTVILEILASNRRFITSVY